MSNRKRLLAAALALPVLLQLALTLSHARVQYMGETVDIEIAAFDPRDLLSGHYLAYRLNYQAGGACNVSAGDDAIVCLKPTRYFGDRNSSSSCELFIRGTCRTGIFDAGLERFYVPAERARELEQAIRDRRGAIRVAVTKSGAAVVKTLLIDGKEW